MSDDPYLDGMQYAWDSVRKYDRDVDVRDAKAVVELFHSKDIHNFTLMVPRDKHTDEIFKAGMFDVMTDYRDEMQKRKQEEYRMKGYPNWIAINGYR